MEGYDDSTYGDAFADVYDDWYADVSDVGATVATLLELADGGPVLELGVGTGRLAVPLAEAGRRRGLAVTGLDSSEAMLAQLRRRDVDHLVTPIHGSMAGDLPAGPFGLVFAAYNTLFNLRTSGQQAACIAAVAAVLAPGGRFVVEAIVPELHDEPRSDVSVHTMTTDRVVLSVSRQRAGSPVAEGQFVELTHAGGVTLRPWSVRFSTPAELDAMAADAGLELEHRWADVGRSSFDSDSDRHLSVYRSPFSADAL